MKPKDKVYVVSLSYPFEGSEIIGAFAKAEIADAFAKAKQNEEDDESSARYEVNELEVQ